MSQRLQLGSMFGVLSCTMLVMSAMLVIAVPRIYLMKLIEGDWLVKRSRFRKREREAHLLEKGKGGVRDGKNEHQ